VVRGVSIHSEKGVKALSERTCSALQAGMRVPDVHYQGGKENVRRPRQICKTVRPFHHTSGSTEKLNEKGKTPSAEIDLF